MYKEKMGKINILATVLLVISVITLSITFSIGLPIYAREFYYIQITSLEIEDITGYDRETIIEGYDEVLDYLTRPGGSFSAGVFKFSESGAEHFKDCKSLFTLNAVIFVVSAVILCALLFLKRFWCVEFISPLGFVPVFWSGAITLGVFSVLGILVSLDFDTAFVIFHSIFFPGKDNWLFNPYYDEIILAMPQDFFMHCAILIGASVVFLSLLFVAFGVLTKIRARRRCS